MKSIIRNNLSEKYGKGTIIIHWVSFLLILVLIPSGFIMTGTKPGDAKILLLRTHIFIGVIVFILTLLRVWFFFRYKRPSHLETGNLIHNKLIVWLENSFYIVLILLSVSGILTVILGALGQAIRAGNYTLLPNNLDVPSLAPHQVLAKLLIALLIVHIVGVVNHYIKLKENTLKRILP
ncbi:cytochrome b/b6 domain-containing protein [Chitinophaga sp.]|uniref:cytochrome b n=1 Tax=Chitinophaga sp. TaxID=1869181 RepID=UPI0031D62CCF